MYGSCKNFEKFIPTLLEKLSNENIPIEDLSLEGFSFDVDVIGSLVNLKTLRHIKLNAVTGIKDTDLVILIAKLPLLSRLVLSLKEATLTVGGLKEVLKLGKQLEYLLLLGDYSFKLMEGDFKLLLKVAKNANRKKRLAICFGCSAKLDFQVPADVLLDKKAQLILGLVLKWS